ncbi:GNAT family N-acetyltransferase, partial [Nocardia terpenica]|uniref:GNAT family N-acetyltransferase n=1 Tax=Nocardia terpenica TaxID=455432 RepID=UPI003A5C550C
MSAVGLEEEWRRRLASAPQPHSTMVAVRNDAIREVVGFTHVCATADGFGELFAIHVHPEAQGMGIGQRLLDAAYTSIRDFGYDMYACGCSRGTTSPAPSTSGRAGNLDRNSAAEKTSTEQQSRRSHTSAPCHRHLRARPRSPIMEPDHAVQSPWRPQQHTPD